MDAVAEADENITRHVDRLLTPLDDAQMRLVTITFRAFKETKGKWPPFSYIEAILDHELLDAREVIASFPVVSGRGLSYGCLGSAHRSLNENEPVGLTVLGLWHVGGQLTVEAQELATDVFRVLRAFVAKRRAWIPSLEEPVQLAITYEDLVNVLPFGGLAAAPVLYKMLEMEPVFYGNGRSATTNELEEWSWNIGRQFLRYQPVDYDIAAYVRQLALDMVVPDAPRERLVASPLALPAALGYLDAVWRVIHGRANHLVVLPSAERTAALSFDVATKDEFWNRLSAFGDIMKWLVVPAGGKPKTGHPVEKLRAYIESQLALDGFDQVSEALDILGAIVTVRNGGEHTEAEFGVPEAASSLGFQWPITDWSTAWQVIRTRATEAIDTIRDQLLSYAEASETDEA